MKSAQTVSGTHSASNPIGTRDRGATALSWPLPLSNAEVMHRDIVLFPLMSNDMHTGHIYFPRNRIFYFSCSSQGNFKNSSVSAVHFTDICSAILCYQYTGMDPPLPGFPKKSPGLWVLNICVQESHHSQFEMNLSLRPWDENWFLHLYHHKVNVV